MIVLPKNKAIWFILQLNLLLLAIIFSIFFAMVIVLLVGKPLLSLVGVAFDPRSYVVFVPVDVLAALAVIMGRREYWFVNRFEFTRDAIKVGTLLGVERTYPTDQYAFVPALHKGIGFPQRKASLSFHVQRLGSEKIVRDFSWLGFGRENFAEVSRFYGYDGNVDFDLWQMGRK